MELTAPFVGYYVRIIALICLLLGLSDAARFLGVGEGANSPMSVLGATGFAYIGVFALCQLFAAVGLWMKTSWGAVLLIGAMLAQLGIYLSGSVDVQMGPIGFALRLVVLLSMVGVLVLGVRHRRARLQD